MQLDERVYHEYAGWQLEYNDILKKIKSEGNDIYYRIKHVADVIDYLYVQLTEDKDYSEEEDQIFKTGYFYFATQVHEINEIVKKYYNNDYKLANKRAKEINLLLNTIEFQDEALNLEVERTEDINKLLSFDEKILSYLNKNKEVPENLYEELNLLVANIFDEDDLNYLTVNNIFLEIADELNIL